MTARTQIAPSRDSKDHRPIATEWRPTLCEIVARLAAGDFALAGMALVDPPSAAATTQMREYVEDYGETLVELPAKTWKTSVAKWERGFWDVFVDLWTEESGRSDMVLKLQVTEAKGAYRFRVLMIYVP